MDADAHCRQDAAVHVDVMHIDEDSAQLTLRKTKEGIHYPEGQEQNQSEVGYGQVKHVDVSVGPGTSFGNEGSYGSGVNQETQEIDGTVSPALKNPSFTTGGIGEVEVVAAHPRLQKVTERIISVLLEKHKPLF